MQEAQKGAIINEVRMSGWLSMNVEYQYTKNGKAMLKTELTAPQGKKEPMVLGVTMWVNGSVNEEAVREAQTFKQGDDVVITGKITIAKYQYRVYVSIEAMSIQ